MKYLNYIQYKNVRKDINVYYLFNRNFIGINELRLVSIWNLMEESNIYIYIRY